MKKKPKDKPKRPLSAYNYFFQSERQRILNYLHRNPSDVFPEPVVDAEEESRLWTGTKKVSFEEMGKLIGRRWKSMGSEEMKKYKTLAAGDAERYKKELKVWNEKKEEEKKQVLAGMYAKNSQANVYQHPGMTNKSFPHPQNGAYRYDPSMVSAPPYTAANPIGYAPSQGDPNAPPPYGQPMAMGSYPYPPYHAPKSNPVAPPATYSNAPPRSDVPPTDATSYHNPYGSSGEATVPSSNVGPYNLNHNQNTMTNVAPDYSTSQNNPDPGNAPTNYYNQGDQYYGSSYQSYPNNDPNQNRWS